MISLDSVSSPLRIDELQVGEGQGWLGMTICPGKKCPSASYGYWQRDLDLDLAAVNAWGASTVVTLLEEHEFVNVEISDLPHRIRALGIDWVHLPIPDKCAPTETFIDAWREQGPLLHERLDRGERILIHCMGGIGRTGTIAAQLLMERGWPHEDAVSAIRKTRLGAIETAEQEAYLRQLISCGC